VKMIECKGYSGLMGVDTEVGVISGRVLGIRDVVTFEGQTVPEAIQAFRDSVDDYLDFCAERGVAPDKPFSGKFIVRIRPELHRKLAIAAEARGKSLNAHVEETLEGRTTWDLPEGRTTWKQAEEPSAAWPGKAAASSRPKAKGKAPAVKAKPSKR
jgi:predicted HicB family RNase H-like nuclease